jgi:hypothetical protein
LGVCCDMQRVSQDHLKTPSQGLSGAAEVALGRFAGGGGIGVFPRGVHHEPQDIADGTAPSTRPCCTPSESYRTLLKNSTSTVGACEPGQLFLNTSTGEHRWFASALHTDPYQLSPRLNTSTVEREPAPSCLALKVPRAGHARDRHHGRHHIRRRGGAVRVRAVPHRHRALRRRHAGVRHRLLPGRGHHAPALAHAAQHGHHDGTYVLLAAGQGKGREL